MPSVTPPREGAVTTGIVGSKGLPCLGGGGSGHEHALGFAVALGTRASGGSRRRPPYRLPSPPLLPEIFVSLRRGRLVGQSEQITALTTIELRFRRGLPRDVFHEYEAARPFSHTDAVFSVESSREPLFPKVAGKETAGVVITGEAG
jgi:hypothetical protein